MNQFEIVTTIDRPVEEVWAFLDDVTRAPEWNPGVTEVRRTSEGPFGVGGTDVYVGRFLGRHYESVSEITEYVVNARYASKTRSGPFYLEVETTLEPIDGGTRVTSVYRGESRGYFKLAEPVITRLTRKQFETAAENMKALLEAEPARV
jgi:carbon monoxide dehydrogenase subunit G